MDPFIDWLRALPLWQAVGLLLLENIFVFGFALAVGHWLVARFGKNRVSETPPPLSRLEIALAVTTIFLNTAVTVVGYLLWKAGFIRFRTDVGWRAWLDILLLLLAMDFAMYWLHRVAHVPWVFNLVHRTHHRFEHPRPLTLFTLNPAETLSFGGLWLAVICLYPASWLGMSIYLFLNVMFGTVGHLGVEPLSPRVARWPVLRELGGSTFHAGHHHDRDHNFGFYTVLWDRIFGTLKPSR